MQNEIPAQASERQNAQQWDAKKMQERTSKQQDDAKVSETVAAGCAADR